MRVVRVANDDVDAEARARNVASPCRPSVTRAQSNRARTASKISAACSWVLGVGFGAPCMYGMWYFARTGEVASFIGYPTYGNGPFATAGIPTSIPLLSAFLTVCAAEVVAGWLLWTQRRSSITLAIVLLPVDMTFWIGFDLPYGPLLGLLRTAAALTSLSLKPPPSGAY